MSKKSKIAIVDDHPLFLEGLISLFNDNKYFEVICSAVSGIEMLNYLNVQKIDVLISDLNMPGMSGIELCKKVKKLYPEIVILIISMHEDPKTIKSIINAGTNGYLFKNSNRVTILNAVSEVSKGTFYLSNEVKDKLESAQVSNDNTTTTIPTLSKREKEVLQLVAKGMTTDQIADQLYISHHTVLSHRKNLLLKLDVNNTVGLIKKALEANLID